MKMLEKRVWPSLFYIVLFLLIWYAAITVWQITTNPPSLSDATQYSITTYTLYTSNATPYTYPVQVLPPNDYGRLINLNFTFQILNLVCNDSSSPFLLVLIHSSPKNFRKRRTIRQTWGGRKSNRVRLAFMLGSAKPNIQQKVDAENDVYKDLVQGDFADSYRNITYKHVMLFKYAIYHCPHAKYILKTDDDVFVNMPTMLQFLSGDLSSYGGARMLFCTPRMDVPALRTYRSKWRVSFEEYPGRKYPTYCPGWALLYSPDVVFDLYREAQEADYFWIDDVHITGTLVERISLQHTDIENLVINNKNMDYILTSSRNVTQPFLYGRPDLDEYAIRGLWEYIRNRNVPKSVLKEMQRHLE